MTRRRDRGNVTLARSVAAFSITNSGNESYTGSTPSGVVLALVEHRYLELLRVAGAKIWRWLVARDRIADSAAVDRLFRGLR